jgi:hypothetical protein
MAGQLTIDTLKASSGVLATQNGMTGIAKAWVNFNGVGTPAIRASFNVSSITDNGTGDYTLNFTTAMPDANYSVVATTCRYSAAVSDTAANDNLIRPDNYATGSVKILSFSISSRSAIDTEFANIAIFSS